MASNPSPKPEIGPDGLARESPIIAYTEKFSSSGICVFLSGNCRRAASITQIRQAKVKEEQARKASEATLQALKDEEAMKQKLCEDLNQLVQESSVSQFTRLEELKSCLEALNPNRVYTASPHTGQPVGPMQNNPVTGASSVPPTPPPPDSSEDTGNAANQERNSQVPNGPNQQQPASGGVKKKAQVHGKGRGVLGAVPKRQPGWTGAGFDVDGRN
ncbi:unnamed protein product [Linum tenue]|uniref:Uncharacterized protein n=1 Tax=Linum tenue TaxID=586396 RepID=A0AAV0J388_9ROSI|nr:unnamed protein product [Linum tenue]